MTQTIQLAVQKDNVNLINQALNSNQPTKIAAEEGAVSRPSKKA